MDLNAANKVAIALILIHVNVMELRSKRIENGKSAHLCFLVIPGAGVDPNLDTPIITNARVRLPTWVCLSQPCLARLLMPSILHT